MQEKRFSGRHPEYEDTGFELYAKTVYAGLWKDGPVFADCLNPGTLSLSSVCHLPVWKFETREEPDAFMKVKRSLYGGCGSF